MSGVQHVSAAGRSMHWLKSDSIRFSLCMNGRFIRR